MLLLYRAFERGAAVHSEQHADAAPVSSTFFAISSAANFGFWRGWYSSVLQSRAAARRHRRCWISSSCKSRLRLVAQPLALEHLAVEVGDFQVTSFIASILRHVRDT